MSDIYFHENLMVVPVEGIDANKVFKPITPLQDCYKSEEKVKEEGQKVIDILAAEVPLFFDGTEIPARQDRRWHFRYVSSQKVGRVDIYISIHDDLGFSLAHHRGGPFFREDFPLVNRLSKQSGVLVEGNYHFGTEPQNMGAHYGREFNGLHEVLNLLYRGFTELTAQSLTEVQELLTPEAKRLPGVVKYWDHRHYTGEPYSHKMEFPLRDLSRTGIEKADQHIGEFVAWLQQDVVKEQILSTATSLSYALKNYDVARELGSRVDIFQELPEKARSIGNSWLEEAAEKFMHIHPPQNERMKIVLAN